MTTKDHSSKNAAEKTKTHQATWPDFAAGLYDKLTGRGAEISYEFNDMNVYIPAKLGEESDHFHWKLDGSLIIRTHDKVNTEENDE